MADKSDSEILVIDGREVAISNPRKVLFPQAGYTKLDLVRYYLAVADGALRGAGGRPNVLVRYPNGIGGEFFYQKRAPQSRPPWIEVVALQLSVRPHRRGSRAARRRGARVDGQSRLPRAAPAPGARRRSRSSRRAARRSRSGARRRRGRRSARSRASCSATLDDFGLVGWPKTSGSRGMHVYVRIERRWTFDEVRRAALALAREVERRAPGAGDEQVVEGRAPRRVPRLQPEREGPHGRQRVLGAARRRTRACRRRSTWDEVDDCDPADFTLTTMPARFAQVGDRHAGIDRHPCSLESLLELSARHERDGLGDAPWPPQYKKQPGEPPRVQPSRADRVRRSHPLRRRSRSRARSRRRMRSPGSSAGRRAIPTRPRTWSRPTCSSTRCAAGFTPGRAIRVNLQHVPDALRPAQEALDPDDRPDDWTRGHATDGAPRRRPSRARKAS